MLVRNVAGTRVELWPADQPKTWPAQRAELQCARDWSQCKRQRHARGHRGPQGNDPLTPLVMKRGVNAGPGRVPQRAPAAFPGVRIRDRPPAPLPVPVARRPGARLRGRDLGRGVQADEAPAATRRPTRSGRRSRVDLRHVPARPRRERTAARRLARPPDRARSRLEAPAAGGQRAPADDRHRSSSGRPSGRSSTASSSRTRTEQVRPRNGGAIVALDPLRRGGARAGVQPDLPSGGLRGPRHHEELKPLPQPGRGGGRTANKPTLDRALDAASTHRADLQASDRDRRDAGDLVTPSTSLPGRARLPRRDTGQRVQELGPVRASRAIDLRTALVDVVRHVLLPRSATGSSSCPRTEAIRSRRGPDRFGFGGRRASTLAPRRRPAADDRVAPRDLHKEDRPSYGRSTALEAGRLDPARDRPEGHAVSPLQMARFYALLANGGKLVTPHLARGRRAAGPRNGPRRAGGPRRYGAAAQELNLDPGAITAIRDGLSRRRTRGSAPRRASSAATRSRSPARRARPRRSYDCRG